MMDMSKIKVRIEEMEKADTLSLREGFYLEVMRELIQRDAQIAALTAENLDLKQYVVDEMRYQSPTTPATDAAANALRAEGLEMLAEQCDGYALNHVYTYTKRHAKEFAKQLREGK